MYNKDLDKLNELTEKINYDDLKCVAKKTGIETDASRKKDPVKFLDDIRNNRITMEEEKKFTKRF